MTLPRHHNIFKLKDGFRKTKWQKKMILQCLQESNSNCDSRMEYISFWDSSAESMLEPRLYKPLILALLSRNLVQDNLINPILLVLICFQFLLLVFYLGID